jgi:tryptophanase
MDYVVEGIVELCARRREIGGYRFVDRPEVLPHFTAVLAPLGETGQKATTAARAAVAS